MIIYQSTKSGFIDDVVSGAIESKIFDLYFQKTFSRVGKSETSSWKKSLRYMRDVVNDPGIPSEAGISIEYQIPQTSKRIDFIITGRDGSIDNAVLIELKQWSEASITQKDGIVMTSFYGEVSHPSYQAWSYAMLLRDFNEAVQQQKIQLRPCAYLHNYIDDKVIRNPFYSRYVSEAPVFLEGDNEKEKLRAFIKQYIKTADTTDIIGRIDSGKIRPSKGLADSIAGMLKGNQEFTMIDEQKVVYETALDLARGSSSLKKHVLIVEGGPGTGKSVVAINLLVELIKTGLLAAYVTKAAAPRAVYESKLTGSMQKSQISSLFMGSGSFTSVKENTYKALIVDEAHRLNAKSGMFRNLGENQIKEIINAAEFSVFFIDEDQKVAWADIGESGEIEKWAGLAKAHVHRLSLSSQFRCNGSDGYLAWLDDVLQIKETANSTFDVTEYDVRIVDSPHELKDLIFEKNKEKNKARLVAGYCWDWVSRRDKEKMDVILPEYDFGIQWNLETDGSLWILEENSVKEIGCIHTCQGLEVDYVGVIVGSDFTVRDYKVVTKPEKRARTDSSIKGYKAAYKVSAVAAREKADTIIKNTYRTLMTRGMKGCYVFFEDNETREYFQKRLGK